MEDFTGKIQGSGYAGRGEGKNNPIMQDVRAGCRFSQGEWAPVDGLTAEDWGPLPAGIYTMQPPQMTATHGPFVLWLSPDESNEMFGRSEFGIHGDSWEHPGLASEGCICVVRGLRESIWASGDHRIQVIP